MPHATPVPPHATTIQIQGFKSFRDTSVSLQPGVNLLLGANGAGKSNFISFFRFLNRLIEQELYLFTGLSGGASVLLHRGPPLLDRLSAKLHVRDNDYAFELQRADDDRFVFLQESAEWVMGAPRLLAPSGARESALKGDSRPVPSHTYGYLSGIRVFHFHDTSSDAPVMSSESQENSVGLAGDARNLAPFLLYLRGNHPEVYGHIRDAIRLIAPFFADFVLVPDKAGRVSLRWRQVGLPEDAFGPAAFSDGTLRFVCLATLLNQPDEFLPKLILIDEPELGLHPHAIQILAELLKSAGARTQLIVATQSPYLVDLFAPDSVIVVERQDNASILKRLSNQDWESWLQEYRLGDIWRMNLLGGTPL